MFETQFLHNALLGSSNHKQQETVSGIFVLLAAVQHPWKLHIAEITDTLTALAKSHQPQYRIYAAVVSGKNYFRHKLQFYNYTTGLLKSYTLLCSSDRTFSGHIKSCLDPLSHNKLSTTVIPLYRKNHKHTHGGKGVREDDLHKLSYCQGSFSIC